MNCPKCGSAKSLEIVRRGPVHTSVWCSVCGKDSDIPTPGTPAAQGDDDAGDASADTR